MKERFNILHDATDEELLTLLRKNDKNAFTAIYERYHKRPLLYGINEIVYA